MFKSSISQCFLSHRIIIMFCIVYMCWSWAIYLFPFLKVDESLWQRCKKGENYEREWNMCMMEIRKKFSSLKRELGVQSSWLATNWVVIPWVRTVLKYLRTPTKSYVLLQHPHWPGTFSAINTYHCFKGQLHILCKMFSWLTPLLRNFYYFFFSLINMNIMCLYGAFVISPQYILFF